MTKNVCILFVFFFECTAIYYLTQLFKRLRTIRTIRTSDVFSRKMSYQASLAEHGTLKDYLTI